MAPVETKVFFPTETPTPHVLRLVDIIRSGDPLDRWEEAYKSAWVVIGFGGRIAAGDPDEVSPIGAARPLTCDDCDDDCKQAIQELGFALQPHDVVRGPLTDALIKIIVDKLIEWLLGKIREKANQ